MACPVPLTPETPPTPATPAAPETAATAGARIVSPTPSYVATPTGATSFTLRYHTSATVSAGTTEYARWWERFYPVRYCAGTDNDMTETWYVTATVTPHDWSQYQVWDYYNHECVVAAPDTPARLTTTNDLRRAADRQAEQVWQRWNGAYWDATVTAAMTEDERRAYEREQRERREQSKRAHERAKQLFLSVLTPEQRASYERDGKVLVRSMQSGRQYLIDAREAAGRHGNIKELDEHGKPVASLCCAPGGTIPHFDAMLGQKLALEFDEHEFRRKANFTPLRRVA